jgi:hypothetical protein
MKTSYLTLVQAVLTAYPDASDTMISAVVHVLEPSTTIVNGQLHLLPSGLPYVERYAPRLLDSKLLLCPSNKDTAR